MRAISGTDIPCRSRIGVPGSAVPLVKSICPLRFRGTETVSLRKVTVTAAKSNASTPNELGVPGARAKPASASAATASPAIPQNPAP